jgi:proteasome lid subunit RPN8/RPN11
MRAHAQATKDKEVCGVLLGQLKKDPAGPFLLVEDVIEGQQAQGSEARVTFTPEAWKHIFKEQEQRDPSLKMVGWYHSHPSFGIFLSQYDRFIHQNFFGVQPWMVAFVLDPVRDEEGFFYWSMGEIRRAERYWIGDQPRRSDGTELDDRVLQDDRVPPATEEIPSHGLGAAPPPAWSSPPPGEEEPLLGKSTTSMLLIVCCVVFLGYVVWNLFVPSPAERRLRELVELQRHMLLYQGDIAAELRELREGLGLPPSKRQGLLELDLLWEEMERQLRARGTGRGSTSPVGSTSAGPRQPSQPIGPAEPRQPRGPPRPKPPEGPP